MSVPFFDVWWVVWIVGFFLVVELVAAFNKKRGDTLSEFVWKVFAIYVPTPKYGHLRRFFLAAFLVALGLHFFVKASVIPVVVFGVGVAWSVIYWWRNERSP